MTPSQAKERGIKVLLPCPFCGGVAEAHNFVIEGSVRCKGCGATLTFDHGPFDDLGLPAAIAAWNRRTATNPPQ